MKKKYLLLFICIVITITLVGCTEKENSLDELKEVSSNFKISASFNHDGFTFVGKENRIGVTNATGEFQTRFTPNESHIYFWRFFAPLDSFGNEVTIKATNSETNETIDILTTRANSFEIPLVTFSLPSGETGMQVQENITSKTIEYTGVWRFDVYFNKTYYDSVVLKIDESY